MIKSYCGRGLQSLSGNSIPVTMGFACECGSHQLTNHFWKPIDFLKVILYLYNSSSYKCKRGKFSISALQKGKHFFCVIKKKYRNTNTYRLAISQDQVKDQRMPCKPGKSILIPLIMKHQSDRISADEFPGLPSSKLPLRSVYQTRPLAVRIHYHWEYARWGLSFGRETQTSFSSYESASQKHRIRTREQSPQSKFLSS